MSTTQIPPRDPPSASPPLPQDPAFYEARPWESYYGEFDDADFPHLLLQLQDDIARSRKREALWLSVIFHLTIVILIVNGPALGRWLPHGRVVAIAPRNLNDKDLTYLEMPPDIQKLTERRNHAAASRTATVRAADAGVGRSAAHAAEPEPAADFADASASRQPCTSAAAGQSRFPQHDE